MVGRVLRPAPGKVNAIVLDHSGAVFQHGFVEDRVAWTLETDKRAESPTHTARLKSGPSSRLLECSQCGGIRTAGEPCGHCGFFPKARPEAISFRDGDLGLVDRKSRAVNALFRSKRAYALALDVDVNLERTRLSSRLDCTQIQRKIRNMAARRRR
jgi:hypothetical protein